MNNDRLVIGFAGDVMIGRNVNAVMNREGYRYIWGDMLPLLSRTDVNIVNLETTLTHSNRQVPKVFNFKASPDKILALSEAKIQIVNLANNHILDFDTTGLLDTLKTLDAAGIRHTGAGKDNTDALKPVVFRKKAITLGVLGFTDNEPGWKAGTQKPGVNYIDISSKNDRDSALTAIQALQKQVDLVIVSIHWGPNLKAYPYRLFIDFAHAMIDQGASIIHGHSAHNFQGVEDFEQRLIFYDTGDFVDDYVVHPDLRNDLSFFFQVEVAKEGIMGATLTPVQIANCQVNHATGNDYQWSLRRIQQLSQKMGTIVSDKGDVLLGVAAGKKDYITPKN